MLGSKDKSNAFHNAHLAAIPAFSEPHPYPARPMFGSSTEVRVGQALDASARGAGDSFQSPPAAAAYALPAAARCVNEWMDDLSSQVAGGGWSQLARECHLALDAADDIERAQHFAPVRRLGLCMEWLSFFVLLSLHHSPVHDVSFREGAWRAHCPCSTARTHARSR